MGHWGTAISANDTYAEVYASFFHYYNHNLSIADIRKQLETDFAQIIANTQTVNDYWFALAKALWECKALDPATFSIVKQIIISGQDIRIWKELEANAKTIKAREKVLDKFLATLSEEKTTAKARKKIIRFSGPYEKGACLAFKMSNGRYGGLLVLEREENTRNGANYVAATAINSATLPTPEDFLQAKILTGRYTDSLGYFREHFWILVFEAKEKKYNKDIGTKFITVGQLSINRIFEEYFEKPFQHAENWAS
jgi:hypothetical protein